MSDRLKVICEKCGAEVIFSAEGLIIKATPCEECLNDAVGSAVEEMVQDCE